MFFLSLLGLLILVSSDNPQGHDSDSNALTWYGMGGLLKGLYSSTWIPINETEALDYYSPYEICKMQIATSSGCLQEKGQPSVDACGSYGRGVGHSNNECSNPGGAFLRHKSITPDSFNFIHLIRSIMSAGSNTLALIGDSVTSQTYSDAYCSTSRANFDMKDFSKDNLNGTGKGFEVVLPINISQKSYDAFRKEFSDVISKDNSKKYPFFQVLYSQVYRLKNLERKTKPFVNSLIEKSSGKGNKVVKSNKEIKGSTHYESEIEKTNNIKGKTVFLVNMGLHFNNADEYRREFKELLNILVPAVLKGMYT
jgi:hypothetical protein